MLCAVLQEQIKAHPQILSLKRLQRPATGCRYKTGWSISLGITNQPFSAGELACFVTAHDTNSNYAAAGGQNYPPLIKSHVGPAFARLM
jgi:hypothetical protein